MMAHVEVVESADKSALDIPTASLTHYDPQGTIDAPSAPAYAVLDYGSINFATLRNRLRGVSIQIAEQSFTSNTRTVPAGSFIVEARAYNKLKAAVIPLGLTAIALPEKPSVHTHEAAMPRVAMYSTWGSTQNVGWVRYAFDQSETPYQLIFKEQVRAGNLRAKYDVIIVPVRAARPRIWCTTSPCTDSRSPTPRRHDISSSELRLLRRYPRRNRPGRSGTIAQIRKRRRHADYAWPVECSSRRVRSDP